MRRRPLTIVGLAVLLEAAVWTGGVRAFDPVFPNKITFAPVNARFVRLVILESLRGAPCVDELEIYGPGGAKNLALAAGGARATASSLLPGYAIHQVAHVNDGLYGNSHSWIAAKESGEWVQIELPQPCVVACVVFSRDRGGRYRDRIPRRVEVCTSLDASSWQTVARSDGFPALPDVPTDEDLVRYAFECEDLTWRKVGPEDSMDRVLEQLESMVERFAARELDVTAERAELAAIRARIDAARRRGSHGEGTQLQVYDEARMAKRRLFLRDPDLSVVERVLFVKRHPFEPSHNYSVILDAAGGVGGGVCVLEIPRVTGRLQPCDAAVRTLFDAGRGICRDPVASDDGQTIYFAFRRSKSDYFHLMAMDSDGSGVRQLTDGPFHDYYPCPLPDGGVAFTSTRCKARFLCWRPQAFVLFRMDADGGGIRPLSMANLSEWTPTVMRDGRLMWTRSEYLDKGADFGHTLWAIRPDGTHPELIFGNNTRNCYAGGREVPGTREVLCTLISHGGDLNGPLALIDPAFGRFSPAAIRSITPDVLPQYHMRWVRDRCFRDPFPVTRDMYLASHAPADRFGIYALDRWGNREVLYLDPTIGSMAPTLLRPRPRPPILASGLHAAVQAREERPRGVGEGQFVVLDVYGGLGPGVEQGTVKYIRVCQELRADLERLPSGEYRSDHEPFQDFYASPTHRVQGPHGWPSYVAKGVVGLAPVEEDGSASFWAPAGKVLYFQVLDEELNEIQRMRSVVQLQAGETRSCIGCHEDRLSTSSGRGAPPLALRREASRLEPPPWGEGPFSYEKVVQPVWDARCVRCHDGSVASHGEEAAKVDLRGTLDDDGVPVSYRELIEQGLVHYFDYTWGREHSKAEPLTFGTVESRLFEILANPTHDQVELSREDLHRVKCWIDLNCPLWPDYKYRLDRPGLAAAGGR